MPSNKAQKRIDTENSRVSESISRLREDIERATTGDKIPFSIARFDAAEELERLKHQNQKATEIPETTSAFLSAIGTNEEEVAQLRENYWVNQAKEAHDYLTSPRASGDMLDWYYDKMMESAEPLGVETLPDLLEKIDVDTSGQELIAVATENYRYFPGYLEKYVAALEEAFPRTEISSRDDALESDF